MQKKLILAPNSFKNNLFSTEIVEYIYQGLRGDKLDNDKWQVIKMPLSDGGDGSISVMEFYSSGFREKYTTVNALGKTIESDVFWLSDNLDNKTVFIEMSSSSGIQVCDSLIPLETSSYGTGLLIKKAIENNAKNIYLCIGGTATTDMGFGLLSALGMNCYDKNGDIMKVNSGNLSQVTEIDTHFAQELIENNNVSIFCLCDGNSLIDGEDGCWERSIQKGATETEKEILKNNILYIMDKIKTDFNKDCSKKEMLGCGGGTAGGLWGLLNSNILLGAEYFIKLSNILQVVDKDSVVLTGEGIVDYTTFTGKLPQILMEKIRNKCNKLILASGVINYNYSKLISSGYDVVLTTDLRNNSFKKIQKENLMPQILHDFAQNLAALLDM